MAATKRPEKLRVPPEGMSIIQLDEIAGRLAELTEVQLKILKHIEETTPEGKEILIFEDTVTGTQLIDPVKQYPYHKLFRAQVINKGSNTVYVRINEEKEVPLDADEDIAFEKPKALIEYITLRVTDSTTVKILGRY